MPSVAVKSVYIKNFKRVVDKKYEFTNGLNTIYGPNYSGKTTITEAILYALYGPSVVPGKAEDMVNNLGKGKPHVEVCLSNGYKVIRKGSNATLLEGDKEIARSASIVSQKMEQVFGLGKDQLMKTRISPQGEAQVLLSTNNAELKRLVEDLSGCTVIDEVASLAKAYKKSVKSVVEALQESYIGDDMMRGLAQAIKSDEAALEGLKGKSIAQTSLLSELEDQMDCIEVELAEARAHNQAVAMVEIEWHKAEARLGSIQQRIDSSPELPSMDYQQELDEECTSLSSRAESLAHTLGEASKTIKDIKLMESDLTLLENDKASYSKAVQGLAEDGDVSKVKAELGIAKDELKRLSGVASDLQCAIDNGVCGACRRPFDTDLDLDKLAQELEQTLAQSKSVSQRVNDLGDEADRLTKIHERRVKHLNLLDKAQSDIERISRDLADAKSSLNGIELDEMRQELDDTRTLLLGKNRELSSMAINRETLASLQLELGQAVQEESSLKESLLPKIDVASLEAGKEGLSEELQSCTMAIVSLNSNIESVERTLNHNTNLLTAGKEQKQRLEAAQSDLSLYSQIDKLISGNRANLMTGVWSGLLLETSQFVGSVTDGYISNVVVDQNFSLRYEEGGKVYPIASASGSQKSLVSLGLRLAIGSMLPGHASFYIMDEVTADMEEQISVTAMALAKKRCPQIISVSHRLSDMTASDNLIEMER